jgi:MFS family permease
MRGIPRYSGYILATTVFGWATGGVIGGIIADYIGRKRTMMLAILAYSLTTGLSAFAWDWVSFAVLRFLVGVAIGSEWATGASIVSELWPDHARGKGGGMHRLDLFGAVRLSCHAAHARWSGRPNATCC